MIYISYFCQLAVDETAHAKIYEHTKVAAGGGVVYLINRYIEHRFSCMYMYVYTSYIRKVAHNPLYKPQEAVQPPLSGVTPVGLAT